MTDNQLKSQYDRAKADYDELKQRLEQLDGSIATLQAQNKVRAVSVAKLKRMKLEEALNDSHDQLGVLERAMREAQQYGTHQGKIDRLVELAAEAREARTAYRASLARADRVVSAHGEQALNIEDNRVLNAQVDEIKIAYQRLREVQRTFLQLAYLLAPGLTELQQVETHNNPTYARRLLLEVEDLKDTLAGRGIDLPALLKEFRHH